MIVAAGFGGGLVSGQPLTAAQFVSGPTPAPTQAHGQFLYHSSGGALYWDADGSGGGAALHLASLTSAPALSLSDFHIV